MDFQHLFNIIIGIIVTSLLGLGKWIVAQINTKLTRAEARELIDDKQIAYVIYVQELKEDIKEMKEKIDKLIDNQVKKD